MRNLLLCLALLLVGCGSADECNMLPRVSYDFVLVNQEPESFFCWTQDHILDLTTDETLAASFASSCTVTVTRECSNTTALQVVCFGVNLSCEFTDTIGYCTNDLGPVTCHYDAWLDRKPK